MILEQQGFNYFFTFGGFILGAVLGSFIKALADRSLDNKSFWGRSYCPKCKRKLKWYDLFPILSYISLRGRCRYCHDNIKIEYLLVELITGILIGFLFWQNSAGFGQLINALSAINASTWIQISLSSSIFLLGIAFKVFFITILLIIFLTDLKEMFIPDRIIIPSIVMGIILGLILTATKIGYLYYTLTQSAMGRLLLPPHSDYFLRHALLIIQPFLLSILIGLLIGGFFLSLIIITRGKGMGGGDVKLGAFMGVILGFPQGVFALILSFLTGALFSLILIIGGKKHFGQTIPFGPFLVLGSLIMLFWGNQLVNWYLHIGR